MLTAIWVRYRRRVAIRSGAWVPSCSQWMPRREGEMRVGGALESVPKATSVALSPCNGVDHEVGALRRTSQKMRVSSAAAASKLLALSIFGTEPAVTEI